MKKTRTNAEIAAGKLISVIQKEWGRELGGNIAQISERVMERDHELLKAKTSSRVLAILNGRSVAQHLGELWVARHQNVVPFIAALETTLKEI